MDIRRKREELGLTQGELAKRSGLTRGQLSLIENGKTEPQAKTIHKINQALGMGINSTNEAKPTTIYCTLSGDTYHIPRHPDRAMQGRSFVATKVKTMCQYPHFAINDFVYSDKAMNTFTEDGFYLIDCDDFFGVYFCIISSDRKRVMFKVENEKYSCDPRVDVWHQITAIKLIGKVVRSARNFDTSITPNFLGFTQSTR